MYENAIPTAVAEVIAIIAPTNGSGIADNTAPTFVNSPADISISPATTIIDRAATYNIVIGEYFCCYSERKTINALKSL